ncbi:MAG TPA: hypothetical protein VJB96_02395 [Patescibacteria group bacterium]|nr:hypothetical protein [Patescibacteria group bacterium]
MKRKDKDEMHSMNATELRKKAGEVRKQLRDAYLAAQTKEVKNRKIVKELRKKLAVNLSVLRIKELT